MQRVPVDRFQKSADGRSACAFISDLGLKGAPRDLLVGDGNFTYVGCEKDRDRDVRFWRYRRINGRAKRVRVCELTIFND